MGGSARAGAETRRDSPGGDGSPAEQRAAARAVRGQGERHRPVAGVAARQGGHARSAERLAGGPAQDAGVARQRGRRVPAQPRRAREVQPGSAGGAGV